MRRLTFNLLALSSAAWLSACQTTSQFPTPTDSWASHTGQLQSSGAGKSVIGEVVVRHDTSQHLQLSFASGPGFPLLKLWMDGEMMRAEGVLARGEWQGRISAAPPRLQVWAQLPAAFAAVSPSRPAIEKAEYSAQAEYQSGRLARLQVRDGKSSERLTFVFAR